MTSTASRGVRARRLAPGLLLVLVVLATVLGTALSPVPGTSRAASFLAPAAADVAADGEVTVELDAITPGVLAPDGTLTVTATVSNGTEETVGSPAVELGLDRSATATRSGLESWSTAAATRRIGTLVDQQSLDPLAPGATAQVTFSVPAADLGLSARSDWGPRGLAVRLSDDGRRLAVARSFVVWAPPGDVPPVRLSMVAAVTGPPVDPDPEAYDDALSAATGADGRLGRVLDATASSPEIGWVVDPALVAAAQASPDPGVTAWAGRLLDAAEGRTTFALRAYDPDVAAYAHAGLPLPEGTPLPGADPEPAVPDEPAAAAWRTDLAWPADPVPDVTTTALAASSGATTVVVGGDALAPDRSLTYTPTGTARVSTPAGDVTALVPDPEITRAVAAGPGADPVAVQRLLAETAVVARERPADARHVLVALPRGWEPDATAFEERVAALQAAPWVDVAPVDELLAAPVPEDARSPLPDDAPAEGEIPPSQLHSLDRTRTELAAFATVAPDPAALTRPLEPGFVVPGAVAYRDAPEARSAAVQHAAQAAQAVMGGVSIERGSPILLLAEEQSLPVRVANDLPQDVEVQVVLRPDDPRLKAPSRQTTTVPADSEVTVSVPVEANGSGNVTVAVEVVSAADPSVRVAAPDEFVVRVRAEWESVGTAVVAALLAIAMVAGIWRTVRRGRSPRRLPGATVDQPAPAPAEPERADVEGQRR
ncbi:DUF6049 family protein [Cellulosimicrobium sp. CUA-896]|uniref:DUF6049 family protein n=1 Tax=Cellulosimicrobium sp. CUA-896 TaxID=1517881 RepID=UPI0009599386|nr:DUF6049 family protein [Cellulosimicrobium sp. CUA-896]OLT46113.1 hypothetical protein BJF88_04590 [Cellulosimicrobium sp. CUA-896]